MIVSPTITISYGDGVGPEIMDAALAVMQKAGASLEIEAIQLGSRVYGMGSTTGVLPSAWESLTRTRILLKAPTITPNGEGILETSATICGYFGPAEKQVIAIEKKMGEILSSPESPIPDPESCFAATAHIGESFALFEPVLDPQPELAGKNKAHPAAMILAAGMMLRHLGQEEVAARMEFALQDTLRSSKKKIRTDTFTETVIGRLHAVPRERLPIASC